MEMDEKSVSSENDKTISDISESEDFQIPKLKYLTEDTAQLIFTLN